MLGNVTTRLLLIGLLGSATATLAAGGSPSTGPDPARPTSQPEGSNALPPGTLPSNPATGNGGDADGSSLFDSPNKSLDDDLYRRPEVDPDHPKDLDEPPDGGPEAPMGNGDSGG
ncbi:hypothetical protein D3C76_136870 [compost metagenome]